MSQIIDTFSNGAIGASCFVMAYQLVRFLVKRWHEGIPFKATLMLAAALFFFGGVGRLILTILIDNDFLDIVVKLMTALISMLTAVLVSLSVDQALKMKTPQQYEELEAEKDKQLKSLRHELKLLMKTQHER
jgi:hypothetical protein